MQLILSCMLYGNIHLLHSSYIVELASKPESGFQAYFWSGIIAGSFTEKIALLKHV